jgi:thioredoxin-like negative regulator of GroEL
MKLKLIKFILLLSLFVVSFLMIACATGGKEEGKESGLYYIGNEVLHDLLSDESDAGFFIYMGRPTCPMCQEFEPILEETLADLKAPLRYFQTDKARADDEERMLMLLEDLGITGIPVIVFVKNGLIRDFLMGMHTQEELIAFFENNGGLR